MLSNWTSGNAERNAHAGQSIGQRCRRSRRRIGLDPEAAVLERIGRQRHATARAWSIESFPIDVVSAAVELAKARQDLVQLAPLVERAEPCSPPFSSRIVAPSASKVLPGPISTKSETPVWLSARIASAKRTASSAWSRQYLASGGSCIGVAETVEIHGDFRRLALHGGGDASRTRPRPAASMENGRHGKQSAIGIECRDPQNAR